MFRGVGGLGGLSGLSVARTGTSPPFQPPSRAPASSGSLWQPLAASGPAGLPPSGLAPSPPGRAYTAGQAAGTPWAESTTEDSRQRARQAVRASDSCARAGFECETPPVGCCCCQCCRPASSASSASSAARSAGDSNEQRGTQKHLRTPSLTWLAPTWPSGRSYCHARPLDDCTGAAIYCMGRSLRGRWREHHRTANSLLASIPQPQLLCRPCSLPPPQPALPPLPPPQHHQATAPFHSISPRRFFPPCAHAVLAALAPQPAAPRVLCPAPAPRSLPRP